MPAVLVSTLPMSEDLRPLLLQLTSRNSMPPASSFAKLLLTAIQGDHSSQVMSGVTTLWLLLPSSPLTLNLRFEDTFQLLYTHWGQSAAFSPLQPHRSALLSPAPFSMNISTQLRL